MRVLFLGSGAWGFALANLAANNGHECYLWSIEEDVLRHIEVMHKHPRFMQVRAHENLHVLRDIKAMIDDIDLIIESVTTSGIRPVMKMLKDCGAKAPIVFSSKGLEGETHLLAPEMAMQELGTYEASLAVLSGPTLAKEVMQNKSSAAVIATESEALFEKVESLFKTSWFSFYHSTDFMGVACGGALKNAYALASGMIDGLGLGHNTKSVLMTLALEEMKSVSHVKGAKKETLDGLSGLGDLCVTCMSNLSRNFSFGHLMGKGLSFKEAQNRSVMVVEGVNTVKSLHHFSGMHKLDLPIIRALHQVLFSKGDINSILECLSEKKVKT
jgi:glycerol-3-phosphate dehydrogenase (NAD(P)+)